MPPRRFGGFSLSPSSTAFAACVTALLATILAPGCSLGQGTGSVCGWLATPGCWSGAFQLHPDFFAAVPTNSSALQIRIQNGIDYETFSDGLVLLIDDGAAIRGDPDGGMPRASLLGQPLSVSLPPSVTPPGVPIQPDANPPLVHATLYLNRTCRTQNVALYATTCSLPAGGQSPIACDVDAGLTPPADAGASADAGPASAPGGVGSSTITFHSLFDGNVNESNAQQRLTDVDFDFYLTDPRQISPGGLGPPPPCWGHLKGNFHFYFQRGRPAQPFP
jgi:hypothetical protein